jgi:hypothetical protein
MKAILKRGNGSLSAKRVLSAGVKPLPGVPVLESTDPPQAVKSAVNKQALNKIANHFFIAFAPLFFIF